MTEAPTRPRKKRSGLVFQVLLVAAILAAIWFSFGRNVLSLQNRQEDLPLKLAEMQLASVIKGTEALAQVNKLHNLNLGLTSAYIAEYSHTFNPYHNSNDKVTVWVGKAESSQAAATLLSRMRQGIEKGGSPFSNLRQITVNEQTVFALDGPGGAHFFYQSTKNSEEVIWLTVEAASPTFILEQALELF
ncbi:MAG: hypothetical protein HYX83_00250 [Chloroflexi bacterium]|nr:hypothetical protein [Chloroflexota bacterium]